MEADEYDKGEVLEDLIPYLLPMKCCIRTKFGDIALSEEEWNAKDGSATQPQLFPGLMFQRFALCCAASSIPHPHPHPPRQMSDWIVGQSLRNDGHRSQ